MFSGYSTFCINSPPVFRVAIISYSYDLPAALPLDFCCCFDGECLMLRKSTFDAFILPLRQRVFCLLWLILGLQSLEEPMELIPGATVEEPQHLSSDFQERSTAMTSAVIAYNSKTPHGEENTFFSQSGVWFSQACLMTTCILFALAV